MHLFHRCGGLVIVKLNNLLRTTWRAKGRARLECRALVVHTLPGKGTGCKTNPLYQLIKCSLISDTKTFLDRRALSTEVF